MRRAWLVLAVVVGFIAGGLTVGAAAAAPPAGYRPPCTANTNTCRQQRIVALEEHYRTHSHPAPTTPPATPTPTPSATSASPTPTPTPTAPAGGIVVLGRSFPGPQNTGVPAGTTLTPYTGPCTIQTAGYVIDKKEVRCDDLRIFAKDVKITNSLIRNRVYADFNAGEGSFTITDSTVALSDGANTGIGDAFFTALRVKVTGGTRSINCYSACTVQDSYVYDQWNDPTGVNHKSGIRYNHGSRLIHNTIGCKNGTAGDGGCSAAITGYADFDPMANNLIDNNLILAGSGGYCAYGGSTPKPNSGGGPVNIRFTNNIWQRGTSPGEGTRGFVCGFYGPITSFDVNRPGAAWTNNLYDDGTVVAPAN